MVFFLTLAQEATFNLIVLFVPRIFFPQCNLPFTINNKKMRESKIETSSARIVNFRAQLIRCDSQGEELLTSAPISPSVLDDQNLKQDQAYFARMAN
jgi:hypothetical protein